MILGPTLVLSSHSSPNRWRDPTFPLSGERDLLIPHPRPHRRVATVKALFVSDEWKGGVLPSHTNSTWPVLSTDIPSPESRLPTARATFDQTISEPAVRGLGFGMRRSIIHDQRKFQAPRVDDSSP